MAVPIDCEGLLLFLLISQWDVVPLLYALSSFLNSGVGTGDAGGAIAPPIILVWEQCTHIQCKLPIILKTVSVYAPQWHNLDWITAYFYVYTKIELIVLTLRTLHLNLFKIAVPILPILDLFYYIIYNIIICTLQILLPQSKYCSNSTVKASSLVSVSW